MADSSRSRIAIALGRNDQVVNGVFLYLVVLIQIIVPCLELNVLPEIELEIYSGDSSSWRGSQVSSSKRQRGESMHSSNYHGFDSVTIRKDDLRLKLMRKDASRQAQSNDNKKHVDLREKLSKPAHSLVINPMLRHRLPVHENMRISRQNPPSRSAENLTRVESMKISCSPWTLDHMCRRPSDQFLSVSRVISPLRNVDHLPRRPVHQTYDDIRSVPYLTKDVPDYARPLSLRPIGSASTSVAAHSSISAITSIAAKPVVPLYVNQLPPSTSSVAPKSSYMDDGLQTRQTVDGLLNSLGLEKYVITFKAEEVDMTALKQMGEMTSKSWVSPWVPEKKFFLL